MEKEVSKELDHDNIIANMKLSGSQSFVDYTFSVRMTKTGLVLSIFEEVEDEIELISVKRVTYSSIGANKFFFNKVLEKG